MTMGKAPPSSQSHQQRARQRIRELIQDSLSNVGQAAVTARDANTPSRSSLRGDSPPCLHDLLEEACRIGEETSILIAKYKLRSKRN